MVLLRRVIGDALRARRQGQRRTLREVSTAANVSLGYLSEIERGQKEASSELLASICEALGARLSEVLREVGDTLALAEQMQGVLIPVDAARLAAARAGATVVGSTGVAEARRRATDEVRPVASGGAVSVSVRQEASLKATLRGTRKVTIGAGRGRDVVCAA